MMEIEGGSICYSLGNGFIVERGGDSCVIHVYVYGPKVSRKKHVYVDISDPPFCVTKEGEAATGTSTIFERWFLKLQGDRRTTPFFL